MQDKKYTKHDTNPMHWDEFEQGIASLIKQVDEYFKEHGEKVDVISQLHRTGGIVGSMMAIKMNIVPLLPVQFKYRQNPNRIEQIISVPDILIDVPANMNILLCEGNTSSGSVAMRAARVVKEKYPESKVYLATLVKVFGCPDKLEGIEHVFHAIESNEKFTATPEQEDDLGLRAGITLLPWECAKDELKEVNA